MSVGEIREITNFVWVKSHVMLVGLLVMWLVESPSPNMQILPSNG